ncbi:MAG TPA: nucleotidyltransferase family protein [Candidatus Omnitrophota bacterium]|nr:nucleotidyltransferase family protein [Candidatus Omnitrophota bacterium]
MNAIILAAGFGTRLYPLTKFKPKALLEIGDKTLLDHLIEKLEASPVIKKIVLVTNSRFALDFMEWAKKRVSCARKPLQIIENDVYEPEKRLGAVQDLRLGIQAGQDYPDGYVVLCGDNYFDYPLTHFIDLYCVGHKDHAFVGLYDVKDKSIASQYGVVEVDHASRITDFQEKPENPKSTRVSIGVYYIPNKFQLRVLEYLEIENLNPDKIGDFFAWLNTKETLHGVDFDGAWFDIGSIESYEGARRHFDKRAPECISREDRKNA